MEITIPEGCSFERVKVSDILNFVVGSCDMGDVDAYTSPEAFWATMIEIKASDRGFGYLVEDLITNGWHEDSAIGLNMGGNSGDPRWRITEGHHRLAAAILLCMDEVAVATWGSDPQGRTSDHPAANYGKRISCHNPCTREFPIKVSYDIKGELYR